MLSQLQPKMFRLEQCLHKLCQGTRKGTDRSRFARDSQPFTTLLSQSSFTRCTKKSSRVLVGGRGGGKNRQIPKDSLQVPAQHPPPLGAAGRAAARAQDGHSNLPTFSQCLAAESHPECKLQRTFGQDKA